MTPLEAAMHAYLVAAKTTPCPICKGTESCDHSVRERLIADLQIPAETLHNGFQRATAERAIETAMASLIEARDAIKATVVAQPATGAWVPILPVMPTNPVLVRQSPAYNPVIAIWNNGVWLDPVTLFIVRGSSRMTEWTAIPN